MKDQVQVLAKMIETLVDWQDSEWYSQRAQHKTGEDVAHGFSVLAGTWKPVKQVQVGKSFRDGKGFKKAVGIDFLQQKQVVYLPPPRDCRKTIPVLSFSAQIGNNAPRHLELRLRLALVECGSPRPGTAPRAVAFRIEYGQGKHAYYHAQLCPNIFGKAGATPADVQFPCWVPEKVPALPVKAEDVPTLLLCLLVGVYGAKGDIIRDLIRRVPETVGSLQYVVGA